MESLEHTKFSSRRNPHVQPRCNAGPLTAAAAMQPNSLYSSPSQLTVPDQQKVGKYHREESHINESETG